MAGTGWSIWGSQKNWSQLCVNNLDSVFWSSVEGRPNSLLTMVVFLGRDFSATCPFQGLESTLLEYTVFQGSSKIHGKAWWLMKQLSPLNDFLLIGPIMN